MAARTGSPDICGHPGRHGGTCGLIPGHDGRHFPVRVVQADPTADAATWEKDAMRWRPGREHEPEAGG